MKLSLMLAVSLAALASPALAADMPSAAAIFHDTDGTVVGAATLTQMDDGVHITGAIVGASEGEHGFHVHAVGICDPAEGFSTAGGHFNPEDTHHGVNNALSPKPHAGDMPNLPATAEGAVRINAINPGISLVEGETGYLFDADGSALVLHAGADDLMSDPSGNAGARYACAVIEQPGM